MLVTGAEVRIGASAAALSPLILCPCEQLQWNTDQEKVTEQPLAGRKQGNFLKGGEILLKSLSKCDK